MECFILNSYEIEIINKITNTISNRISIRSEGDRMKSKMSVSGIIVPTYLEPNGKMKKFLETAKNPKVQKEYQKLLAELKTNPENFGRKLREIKWKDKDLDRIYEDLVRAKSK